MLGIFACHELLVGELDDYKQALKIADRIGGDLLIERLCEVHPDEPKTSCYPCRFGF